MSSKLANKPTLLRRGEIMEWHKADELSEIFFSRLFPKDDMSYVSRIRLLEKGNGDMAVLLCLPSSAIVFGLPFNSVCQRG